ncbi:MAG: alkaline phosphatase D family protein [Parvularcula sp.]
MGISRREALVGTMLGGLAGCATSLERTGPLTSVKKTQNAVFQHGVASGDPDMSSVILWTRITTDEPIVPAKVQIAKTPDFSGSVMTLKTETSGARDHTIKVLATGLEPGTTYYYRFTVDGAASPVGRTRTLPEKTNRARFAVCSCSNYPFGYFNAYDHMARREDIDAVIHLGDYIYEYGPKGYGGKEGAALGRPHQPPREIISLADYRARHAQYKADPSSQAMHAAHPMIAVWDDHETANDSFSKGAENHTPKTEGEWNIRRAAALQAYYEWMPVREPEPGRLREALYRDYQWGGLLTLSMIETRLTARDRQIDYGEIVPTLKTAEDIERFKREILNDPNRHMMGGPQLDYLKGSLAGSVSRGEPWRIVGNQVLMARLMAPNLTDYLSEERIAEIERDQWDGIRDFVEFSTLGLPVNMDAWDGYPAARQRFYKAAQEAGARDLLVLTGDTHEAWGNDLYDDNDVRMGVELGTTSITSPGSKKYLGDGAADYSLLIRKENRDIRFHDSASHGYILLDLEEDRGTVDYIAVSTITEPTYEAFVTARFDLKKRNGTVDLTNGRGLGFKEKVLF